MVRVSRWLRIATRMAVLSVLGLTAVSVLQLAPDDPKPADPDDWAPRRLPEETAAQTIARKLSGGPASVSAFGVAILDPGLALMSALSAPRTAGTVALALVVPVLVTLLAGRIFCGYLCPVGWLATAAFCFRRWSQGRLRLPVLPVHGACGYLLLGAVAWLALAGAPSGFSMALLHLQVQRLATCAADPAGLWPAAGALTAFAIFALVLSPGGWCRHLCPSGIIYGWIGQKRLWGVVRAASRPCPKGCHHCSDHCWLGLSPKAGDPGPACDSCLTCARVCPKGVLHLGRTGARRRPGRGLGIGLMSLVVGVSLACPGRAMGAAAPARLDDNPPWSVHINRLDGETWTRRGALRAGLSLSFVEQTGDADLYLFAAAVVDDRQTPAACGPAELRLRSGGGTVSLGMAGPNAPRSTSRRSVYAGRAIVEPDRCYELTVSLPSCEMEVGIAFPESCRANRLGRYSGGALLWGGGLAALLMLGFAARIGWRRLRPDRGRNRSAYGGHSAQTDRNRFVDR